MNFFIWPAKPGERIYRDSIPRPEMIGKPLELKAARNEFEGNIFGIRSNIDLHECRIEVSDLKGFKDTISKDNIRYGFIGFIPVSKNTPDTPIDEIERRAPIEVPDPILDLDSIDIKAENSQPCWYSVYVPKNISSGEYRGYIRIYSREGEAKIDVILHVYPITLPDERNLYVTNWFNVDKIASTYNIELWSDDFWKIFEKWIKFMSKYRQNVFLVPLHTIKIIEKDGKYVFDFSIFDKYVEILFRNGADRIEISHIAHYEKWGGDKILFRDFKVKTINGEERNINGSEILPHLLPALEKHLVEKNWIDKAMIHVCDEPTEIGIDEWKKFSSYVHRYSPKIRRIDAIETVGFKKFLEIWVLTLNHFNDWMENYANAMKQGYEVWFYTCCNPKGRYPNRFLDYPLVKTRILHWINYAYGLKGYLHWGFNHWGEDPFGEPRANLPPGDTHIAYPGKNGPLSSLRLEAMRDGLEDYEYLKLLEDEIKIVKRILGRIDMPFERRSIEICRRIVENITSYPRNMEKLLEVREEIVKEILEIKKKPYILVLTEPPEYRMIVEGPAMILVKGICEKDAQIEVNGRSVKVRDGYFATYIFLTRRENKINIRITKDGETKIIERIFKII